MELEEQEKEEFYRDFESFQSLCPSTTLWLVVPDLPLLMSFFIGIVLPVLYVLFAFFGLLPLTGLGVIDASLASDIAIYGFLSSLIACFVGAPFAVVLTAIIIFLIGCIPFFWNDSWQEIIKRRQMKKWQKVWSEMTPEQRKEWREIRKELETLLTIEKEEAEKLPDDYYEWCAMYGGSGRPLSSENRWRRIRQLERKQREIFYKFK